jgi:hypothetical protein
VYNGHCGLLSQLTGMDVHVKQGCGHRDFLCPAIQPLSCQSPKGPPEIT